MNLGQTTGARAILQLQNTFDYVSGKIRKFWTREKVNTYAAADIAPILQAEEVAAAVLQTSQIVHEYNSLFCLNRDIIYTGRSRRWLYARALISKTDQAYEAWAVYVRENLGTNVNEIFNSSVAELETADFKETMGIQATGQGIAITSGTKPGVGD